MGTEFLRRCFAVFALISVVALVGASHRPSKPPATPTPSPTPTPTPAPPSVIIYPFSINGEADKRAGVKLASLYTKEIQTMGGVMIKPPLAANVDRKLYLTDAIQSGADYYLSGYITPLGEQVAVVQQLVSTQSGAIIWSTTAQMLTYSDAADQADTIRRVLLAHAGRVEASYQAQQTSATPAPEEHGAQTNIASILGIFHRLRPGPKPTLPPEKKPKRGILVVQVAASPNNLNNNATTALALSLNRAYNVARSAVLSQNVVADSHVICGALPNETIATGDFHTDRNIRHDIAAVFTLKVYRCDGSLLYTNTARSGSLGGAIDLTVNAFMKDHPNND
ncbi:MAG: hypothetical protein JO233_08055 [Candidatus Eremiobacteraeota bacterium]|nr:hypothetical protein [Candidatus Eremiobacteraeota bacterium]